MVFALMKSWVNDQLGRLIAIDACAGKIGSFR